MKYIHLLKNEWEITLFVLALCSLGIFLLSWFFGLGNQPPVRISQNIPQRNPGLLNYDAAFAFLDHANQTLINPANSPFILPRPPKSNNGSGVNVTVTPKPKPKPKPKPEPKSKSAVEYLGTMTTSTGAQTALLKNSKTGTTRYVIHGEKYAGLKILNFSRKSINVQLPNGKQTSLKLGQKLEYNKE